MMSPSRLRAFGDNISNSPVVMSGNTCVAKPKAGTPADPNIESMDMHGGHTHGPRACPVLSPRESSAALTPRIFSRRIVDPASARSIGDRHMLGASAAKLVPCASMIRLHPPSSPGCSTIEDVVSDSPSSKSAGSHKLGRTSKSLSFEGSGFEVFEDADRPRASCGGAGMSGYALQSQSRALVLEGRMRDTERERERLRYECAQLKRQMSQRSATMSTSATQTEHHPQFGILLIDLGFKKVYSASARTLVNSVPLWSKQRPCNEGRVDEIVRSKSKDPAFIGAVMCFEFEGMIQPSLKCPQPVGIFDGQHRVRAAAKLLESDDFVLCEDEATRSSSSAGGQYRDFPLVVEVYSVNSETDIKALYLEVNKGESVKEIDLPDAIAPARKLVIDTAVDSIVHRWPEMFKPSERCRPPHLHKDTLRNRLFQHPATMHVENATELVSNVTKINEKLAKLPKAHWAPRVHRSLEKAKANHCYLGLDDYSWLDHLG
uniref:Uncharacterized protein n=1 Tax=Coccolithus braarudii TaxID=221442 RepID=A0A7S0LP73_9EUKA